MAMIMLIFNQAEFDLILYALQRLEQDESGTAGALAEDATNLLARWDVKVYSNLEEE